MDDDFWGEFAIDYSGGTDKLFDFSIDPATLGGFNLGDFGSINLDSLGGGTFDREGLNLGDIGVGAFDLGGFNLGDLGIGGSDNPYFGLGYSDKDIQQLIEGTYAGPEQTKSQVISQLGEDLYNQLYPMGIENLSSSAYEGLGYTAKDIADLMAGQEGIRETDWSGVIRPSTSGMDPYEIDGLQGSRDEDTALTGTTGGTTTITNTIKELLGGARDFVGNKDNAMLIALLGGLLGLLGKGGTQAPAGYKGGIPKYTATRGTPTAPTAGGRRPGGANIPSLTGGVTYTKAAGGGLMDLAEGGRPARYLRGGTDGMADKIKTDIDGKQPARLSSGEFVIPADVVGALGSGNSEAGANVLYDMMDRVRKHAHGHTKQIKQANPKKVLPA